MTTYDPAWDFNGDGTIDSDDLLYALAQLQYRFGATRPNEDGFLSALANDDPTLALAELRRTCGRGTSDLTSDEIAAYEDLGYEVFADQDISFPWVRDGEQVLLVNCTVQHRVDLWGQSRYGAVTDPGRFSPDSSAALTISGCDFINPPENDTSTGTAAAVIGSNIEIYNTTFTGFGAGLRARSNFTARRVIVEDGRIHPNQHTSSLFIEAGTNINVREFAFVSETNTTRGIFAAAEMGDIDNLHIADGLIYSPASTYAIGFQPPSDPTTRFNYGTDITIDNLIVAGHRSHTPYAWLPVAPTNIREVEWSIR